MPRRIGPLALRGDARRQEGEMEVHIAFAAHLAGLLCGAATIMGLVPPVVQLMRMLAA
jgi:membrane associated rhomboid family serine protease